MTGPSHPCSACGGLIWRAWSNGYAWWISARYSDSDPLGPYDSEDKANAATALRCPVCLGSGRISDRVTVAQAMADAEQLRVAVRGQPEPIDDWDCVPTPDYSALRCGIDEQLWARGVFHETAYGLVTDAMGAAAIAFHAVPALRGE